MRINPLVTRRAATRGAFSMLLLAAVSVAGMAQATYVERLAAGIRALDAAKPEQAAESLRAAMRLDANHPAAWLAYGALLLDTRHPDTARKCFARAESLAPKSARPMMGLALCDVAEGKLPEADRRFEEAARRGAEAAILHRAYLAAMNGKAEPARALLAEATPAARGSALGLALAAHLSGNGSDPAAWETALSAMRSGRDPLLASFTAWKPFNHGWQARPEMPMPPGAPATALHGPVPLSGEASADTKHVTFIVDGVVAGITNVRPFQWTWDTTAYPNGWHTVRVTAERADGSTVTRERRVWTKNPNAPDPPEYEGMDALLPKLDALLTLCPDDRYARIVLARAAMEAKDTPAARQRLQGVVAEDPKYWNAAHMLKALPRTASTTEIWRGPSGSKRIALTFDDGPNLKRTPPLLDVLDRIGVPATFFLVGKQAAVHPDMVRRMARSGHQVENHTWNHRNMAKLTEAEALMELASTSRLLASLTGRAPRYFRPPGGNTSAAAREAAAALNMSPAMWTFASGKSEGLPIEYMAPAFTRAAKPGAIYLIHNGTDKILDILPKVVQSLRRQGYEFVTLDELMGDGAPNTIETSVTASPTPETPRAPAGG